MNPPPSGPALPRAAIQMSRVAGVVTAWSRLGKKPVKNRESPALARLGCAGANWGVGVGVVEQR